MSGAFDSRPRRAASCCFHARFVFISTSERITGWEPCPGERGEEKSRGCATFGAGPSHATLGLQGLALSTTTLCSCEEAGTEWGRRPLCHLPLCSSPLGACGAGLRTGSSSVQVWPPQPGRGRAPGPRMLLGSRRGQVLLLPLSPAALYSSALAWRLRFPTQLHEVEQR